MNIWVKLLTKLRQMIKKTKISIVDLLDEKQLSNAVLLCFIPESQRLNMHAYIYKNNDSLLNFTFNSIKSNN